MNEGIGPCRGVSAVLAYSGGLFFVLPRFRIYLARHSASPASLPKESIRPVHEMQKVFLQNILPQTTFSPDSMNSANIWERGRSSRSFPVEI